MFVEATREVSHTFQVRNPTARTVRVRNLSRSCTCTDATLSAMEIAPGGTVDLAMRINVRPGREEMRVASSLDTDDPDIRYWNYEVQFRGYPGVRFANPMVSLDGATPEGQPAADGPKQAEAALEFYRPASTGAQEPAPKFDLATRPPVVAVVAEPTVTPLEGGAVELVRFPIRVSVDPALDRDKPSGTETAEVVARRDDGTEVRLGLVWSRRAPLLVTPSSVSFGIVTGPDEAVARKLVVRATDGRPFHILAAETGSPAVAAEFQPAATEAAPVHTIALSFRRPESADQAIAHDLVVRTDHPEMPALRVSWSALTP